MNNWVNAGACCVIHFLIMATARLSPILFVASMERYNSNRARAAFPYVLCYTLRFLSGPVVGIVGRKYDLRRLTLLGCILSVIGTGLCYFAEDLTVVSILWGAIYGFGFNFGTSALPVILNLTFEAKHKTKANGIALAGSCLGGIIMPPIMQAAITEYGLSGAFLILSGFMLHSLPVALLLHVPNSNRKVSEKVDSRKNAELNADQKVDRELNELKCSVSHNAFSYENARTNQSESTEVFHETSILDPNSYLSAQNNTKYIIFNEEPLSNKDRRNCYTNMTFTTGERSESPNMRSDKVISNMYDKNIPKSIVHSDAFKDLDVSKVSETHNSNGLFSVSNSCTEDENQPVQKEDKTQPVQKEDKKHDSMFESLRIFVDPTFIFIMVTQSAYAFSVTIIWTIVVDVLRDKGIDRSIEVYVMMVLPLSDMIGRLGLSWVTDRGYLSKIKFSVLSFFFSSLFTILFAFVHSLPMISLVLFLFGFVTGGLTPVFPGIVCDSVNSRYTLTAMSSRMLLMAPLSITTSPLIGYFREGHGSYDGIYYLLFCIFLVCCGITALIPRLSQNSKLKHVSEER